MPNFLSGLASGLQTGMQIRQQQQQGLLQQQQMELQQEQLGLQREKFELQRDAFEQQQRLQQQGQEALRTGGMGAFIQFQKATNPKLGMALEKDVAQTNKLMAETLGIQEDNKLKRLEALQGAHGMIGSFGSQLAQMPEAQRAAAYQAMLPKLKSLNPELPDSYDDAAKVMMEGHMMMALPATTIFAARQEANKLQTKVGQAISDRLKLESAGKLSLADKKALEAERDELMLKRQDARATALAAELKATSNKEDKFRQEWNKLSKQFRDVQTAGQKALNSLNMKTAAGDHAGIFAYMKTVDPGSTVREGEFATVENSGGIPAWVRGMYNKAVDGKRLTPEMRKQFIDVVNEMTSAEEESYNMLRDRYTTIATKQGLDLDIAMPEYKENKVAMQQQELQKMNLPNEVAEAARLRLEQGQDFNQVKSLIERYMQKYTRH